MPKQQVILAIGKEDIRRGADALRDKWIINGRSSQNDHEIIYVDESKELTSTKSIPLNPDTRLTILAHGNASKRDGFYGEGNKKIISLESLAKKIKAMCDAQNSDIGTFVNPLNINLVSCNAGWDIDGDKTSIAENFHRALLKEGVCSNITARDSIIQSNLNNGRKSTMKEASEIQSSQLHGRITVTSRLNPFRFYYSAQLRSIFHNEKNYGSHINGSKHIVYTSGTADQPDTAVKPYLATEKKPPDFKEKAREILFKYWNEYVRSRTFHITYQSLNKKRQMVFENIIEKINKPECVTSSDIDAIISDELKKIRSESFMESVNPFSNSQLGLFRTKTLFHANGMCIFGSSFYAQMSAAQTEIQKAAIAVQSDAKAAPF